MIIVHFFGFFSPLKKRARLGTATLKINKHLTRSFVHLEKLSIFFFTYLVHIVSFDQSVPVLSKQPTRCLADSTILSTRTDFNKIACTVGPFRVFGLNPKIAQFIVPHTHTVRGCSLTLALL